MQSACKGKPRDAVLLSKRPPVVEVIRSTNQLSSQRKRRPPEFGSGLLSWLSPHYHGGDHVEKSVARHSVWGAIAIWPLADPYSTPFDLLLGMFAPTPNRMKYVTSCLHSSMRHKRLSQVTTNIIKLKFHGLHCSRKQPPGVDQLKRDLYAFRVLELLTGRQPIDSSRPRQEQSMVKWALTRLHDYECLEAMVDPTTRPMFFSSSVFRCTSISVRNKFVSPSVKLFNDSVQSIRCNFLLDNKT
ncbi:hypothetical protein IFM89_031261 [Coptis chinensis]|uniref:Uncharacterized protein n=1 Tax=Coptis chinensis TaxID=261450 RepID=A0A835IYM0_9MAGN|nr:hypothetical protein IFM89_031261 [Coptis chinensis]